MVTSLKRDSHVSGSAEVNLPAEGLPSTIYPQLYAGDPGRIIAGQEERCLRDFIRSRNSA